MKYVFSAEPLNLTFENIHHPDFFTPKKISNALKFLATGENTGLLTAAIDSTKCDILCIFVPNYIVTVNIHTIYRIKKGRS